MVKEIKKPKRRTKDMVLCFECKKPIHSDDLAGICKKGLWHKQCSFKILYLNMDSFLTGYELKVRTKKERKR